MVEDKLREEEERRRIRGCIRWLERMELRAKILEVPSIEALAHLTIEYLRKVKK